MSSVFPFLERSASDSGLSKKVCASGVEVISLLFLLCLTSFFFWLKTLVFPIPKFSFFCQHVLNIES